MNETTDSLRARFERSISPGLGTCLRCQRPWQFPATRRTPTGTRQLNRRRFFGLGGVDSHITNYNERSGCFPLCEGCWAMLSIEERVWYYRALVTRWMRGATGTPNQRAEEQDRYLNDEVLILEAVRNGL